MISHPLFAVLCEDFDGEVLEVFDPGVDQHQLLPCHPHHRIPAVKGGIRNRNSFFFQIKDQYLIPHQLNEKKARIAIFSKYAAFEVRKVKKLVYSFKLYLHLHSNGNSRFIHSKKKVVLNGTYTSIETPYLGEPRPPKF